jgi:hypothetical protein
MDEVTPKRVVETIEEKSEIAKIAFVASDAEADDDDEVNLDKVNFFKPFTRSKTITIYFKRLELFGTSNVGGWSIAALRK